MVYPNPTQDSPVKGPALSIFYVGAEAERNGFSIEYVDERFDGKRRIQELLKENRTHTVAISTMTGFQLGETCRILKWIKEYNPGILTIVGGVHPTLLTEQTIEAPFIDFIVKGEGERTFVELLKEIKGDRKYHEILGLTWKNSGKIVNNCDRPFTKPEEWPFPMTKKSKPYYAKSVEAGEMFYLTSRGCPYSCRFCYNNVFNKKRYRTMPVGKVKNELKMFHDELEFDYLFLNDDNVGSNIKNLEDIAAFLRSLGIRWGTCIRADNINEHTLKILDDNGCDRFLLGVETGSERVLKDLIGKKLTNGLEDIRNAVRLIAGTGIKPTYSFMTNIPGETAAEAKISIDFANWVYKTDPKSRIGFYVYAPYPGTEMFRDAIKARQKLPNNIHEWAGMSLSNSENEIAENIYYISGLKFRGDVSRRKFPGIRRLKILPFEIEGKIRWKLKFFRLYKAQKTILKRIYKEAI